jgi:hypothetical protein
MSGTFPHPNPHATSSEERGFLAVSLESAARLARALAKCQGQPKHGGLVEQSMSKAKTFK